MRRNSRLLTLLLLALLPTPRLLADTVKLKSGTTFRGKLEATADGTVRFRTPLGMIEVAESDIASIEYGPPPWEEYDRLKSDYPDTADGQFRLAVWCRANGLENQARKHYQRTIELDPDHAAARSALGYRRIGGEWKKPGAASRPAARHAVRPGSRPAAAKPPPAKPSPEDKLVRELIAKWHGRVTAIYRGRLENHDPTSKAFEEGRAQILAMHDPLAIPAISSILSKGRIAAIRAVLVQSLAQFPQDEATMNLVVISLLDPDPMIRRKAALVLYPRNDKRVVARLRQALSSNEDTIVRNAAVSLGILRAREAVEDLATALYTVERQNVRFARTEIIGEVWMTFNRQVLIPVGNQHYAYHPDVISVLSDGTAIGTTWVDEVQDVTVYRTDVQEALIHITGQNFGFNPDAWIAWARQHPPEK